MLGGEGAWPLRARRHLAAFVFVYRSIKLDVLAYDSTLLRKEFEQALGWSLGGPRPSGHATKISAQLERTAEASHKTVKVYTTGVSGV